MLPTIVPAALTRPAAAPPAASLAGLASSLAATATTTTSLTTSLMTSLTTAWTGQREYGLAQIQEPVDVLRAVVGLIVIATLTSPAVFGFWFQLVRPQLVARGAVDATDAAIDREASVALALCASVGAFVVSTCLDCGH